MADIIYTGKGAAQALQGGGQSLQALGQFSAQQQQTKRDELSKAIKDQDTFLNMLKTDPVYTASQKANKEIADSISGFVDKWGDIYRQKGGQLSTSDLADMQANKGAVVAKMNHFKASNDQVLKASMEFQRNRDKYDPEEFYEGLAEYNNTGFIPEGGLLQPAYVDPLLAWTEDETVQPSRWDAEFRTDPETEYTTISRTPVYDQVFPGKDGSEITIDEYRETYALGVYRGNSMRQYQYAKKFERVLNKDQKEYYAKVALEQGYRSPQEAFAVSEGRSHLWRESPKYGGTRSPRRETTKRDGIQVTNNGLVISDGDNQLLTYSDNVVSSMIGKGKGIEITNRYAPEMAVPASALSFNEDIIFADGAMVYVRPNKIVGDKIQYSVDKNKNRDVYKVVYDYEDVPYEDRVNIREDNYFTTDNGRRAWKYKTRMPSNVQAAGNVTDVIDDIDGSYDSKFKDWYIDLFKPKPEVGTYKLKNGQEVTKQQLLDAGWTETDIKKLEDGKER